MASMPDSAGEVTASALSQRAPGVVALPASTKLGAAGVRTGFPRTPAGAMAQMLAIDVTALQTKQLAGARRVISAWAAPNGPTPSTWDRVQVLSAIMSDGGLSDGDAGSWAFRVTPVMGLIKGTVGPGFVVPCVDYEFEATSTNGATLPAVALGGCARMQWAGDHWAVTAGTTGSQTAPGSSVWPDTDQAIKDGYKDLDGVAAALTGR